MTHTPTPWHIEIYNNGKNMDIQDIHGECVITKENAPFIVKACNAHDELVDVLETCLAYVDCGSPRSESDMVEQSIRKALAKAKKVTQ